MNAFAPLAAIEAARALDVGCGLGGFIAQLVTNLGRCDHVTAVDVVDEYGPALKERFPALSLDYRRMEGERLEFADGSFDAASISYALHHVRDPLLVLTEMRRVLRPGGWLIVAEPHSDTTTEAQRTDLLVHGWRARVDTLLGVRHNQTFARAALLGLVDGLGLRAFQAHDYLPTDRERDRSHTLEQIRHYQERLAGDPGTEAGLLRAEGRSLAAGLDRTGVEAAPALLLLGRV